MQDMVNKISEFFLSFKNKEIEAIEISKNKEFIDNFSNLIKKEEHFKKIYDNYLLIKGYTYRLDNVEQRLFYTFKEAVYAIDLSKLTRDEEGVKLNSLVYILVLKDCIAEYLNEDINEDEKNKAITAYKTLEDKKAKENEKYHMYQY